MVSAGVAETFHQIEVIWTEFHKRFLNIMRPLLTFANRELTITLLPRFHRVTHPTDSVLPTHNFKITDFQHNYSPFPTFEKFYVCSFFGSVSFWRTKLNNI